MFSRRPLPMVYKTLLALDFDYFLLEERWCFTRMFQPGCALRDLYDIEDVEFRSNKPVCEILRTNFPNPYFTKIFQNQHYIILKLNK